MVGMLVLQAQSLQAVAELLGRKTSQGGRIALRHHLKHLCSRKPSTFFFVLRCTETGEEHVFQQRLAIETLVPQLKFPLLLLGQMVTLTAGQFVFQLGIQLLMPHHPRMDFQSIAFIIRYGF